MRRLSEAWALAAVVLGCTTGESLGVFDDGDSSATNPTTASATSTSTTDASTTDKLDLPDSAGTVADDGGQTGCEKIDFLFVIDNSGSMEDEQQNLVASFPGFIAAIQDTLMAQDYHIMVVDTDAESLSFQNINCNQDGCTCEPEPQCCFLICSNDGPVMVQPPPTECAGQPCDEFVLPTGCDVELGAGKTDDPLANDCGIAGGARYMVDTQPDLPATFACVAAVGAGGDGNERPMEAMVTAITTETATGECNDGFLRDDAILVVTFITDEEDEGSHGTPATWKQALVDAKNGQEDAIVVLGLVGDPGGVCSSEQADDAPTLRAFAESFTHGAWASVCEPDYAPFFLDSVATIDTTCDEFEPVG